MRAMFRSKIKLNVFFSARKAVDACREVAEGGILNSQALAPERMCGWL